MLENDEQNRAKLSKGKKWSQSVHDFSAYCILSKAKGTLDASFLILHAPRHT